MKQNKINRPIRSTTSQVIAIFAMLTLFVFCIYGVTFLVGELKTGQTYSPMIVFGDSSIVNRSSSPKAYWADLGLYSFGFFWGIVAAILGLREVAIEHKRKIAWRKQNHSATTKEEAQ